MAKTGLNFGYIDRLRTLLGFFNLKLHGVAVIQGLETIANNAGKMDKDVSAGFLGDKSITFGCVEPLDGAFFHTAKSFPEN
jgi:hypothetical protein